MNPKIDWFFNKESKWQDAYLLLRAIALECELTEELKWGLPCYSLNKANIVIIQGFKEYCALMFFKGVLLKDPKKILIQMTENVQAARQLRFNDVQQITEQEKILKTYIKEAIEIEKSGLKVKLKKTSDYKMPDEFKNLLDKNSVLKKSFEALTPGRQRGYLFYFAQAKQSNTRKNRIEKYIPKILEGKGLND